MLYIFFCLSSLCLFLFFLYIKKKGLRGGVAIVKVYYLVCWIIALTLFDDVFFSLPVFSFLSFSFLPHSY